MALSFPTLVAGLGWGNWWGGVFYADAVRRIIHHGTTSSPSRLPGERAGYHCLWCPSCFSPVSGPTVATSPVATPPSMGPVWAAPPLGRQPTASPRPWPMPWPHPRPLPTRFAPGPHLASCSSDAPRHAQRPAHHHMLRSSHAHAAHFTTSWVFLVLNIVCFCGFMLPLYCHLLLNLRAVTMAPTPLPSSSALLSGGTRLQPSHRSLWPRHCPLLCPLRGSTLPAPFAHHVALAPLHVPVLACTRSPPHRLCRPSHRPALSTRHNASVSHAIRNSRRATRLSLLPGPGCHTHARPAGSPRFPGHISPAHGPNDARTDSCAHPASFTPTPAPITVPSQTAHTSGGSSATHCARVTPIPCGPSLGLTPPTMAYMPPATTHVPMILAPPVSLAPTTRLHALTGVPSPPLAPTFLPAPVAPPRVVHAFRPWPPSHVYPRPLLRPLWPHLRSAPRPWPPQYFR